MSETTISVPESVMPLESVLSRLLRYPALTPLSTGVMIEMPCCGFRFDAEAIDSAPGPSRVYWPPRWTCPSCERTFTANGDGLVESVGGAR